jgi:hypothetical protein
MEPAALGSMRFLASLLLGPVATFIIVVLDKPAPKANGGM